MEGSYNRNLKAYEYLAHYYDLLLSDEESLSYWLKYIEKEDFKDVLELASGSGIMAKILKNKGHNVIASDISESMKDASITNFDGEYLILDMKNYDLHKTFDLVLCICDSINYLQENEIDSFLKCAYKHLNNKGRLIFDMHHLERLKEFQSGYIEEGELEDINYQWTIMSDLFENSISEHFTFYTRDGMIQEHHKQYVFKPEVVIEKMQNIGFSVEYIEDFIDKEKVLLVGRK